MVDVLDVIHSIVQAFKVCVPTSKHYLGKLPENYKAPCFLYTMVFIGDKRETKYIKESKLDLQIIYLGSKDGYSGASYEDMLKVMGRLKVFLDTFMLTVGDRRLTFSYNFGEADDQLTVNMAFKFKDGLIDEKFNEEQAREMIEQINIKNTNIDWTFKK